MEDSSSSNFSSSHSRGKCTQAVFPVPCELTWHPPPSAASDSWNKLATGLCPFCYKQSMDTREENWYWVQYQVFAKRLHHSSISSFCNALYFKKKKKNLIMPVHSLKGFHLIHAFAVFFGWSFSGTTWLACQICWTFTRFIA